MTECPSCFLDSRPTNPHLTGPNLTQRMVLVGTLLCLNDPEEHRQRVLEGQSTHPHPRRNFLDPRDKNRLFYAIHHLLGPPNPGWR